MSKLLCTFQVKMKIIGTKSKSLLINTFIFLSNFENKIERHNYYGKFTGVNNPARWSDNIDELAKTYINLFNVNAEYK